MQRRYRASKSFMLTIIMNLEVVEFLGYEARRMCIRVMLTLAFFIFRLHIDLQIFGDIWRLGGGDMLNCRHKNPNNQDDLPPLDLRMVPLLQATDFYSVARVASLQLDWSLISTLVERWRPETHTFRLLMGEVTITLHDVGIF
ncbi:hypothetical protein AgCh_037857 [Apium graveolens]